MSTEVNYYRIWCTTEAAYVYTWDTVEPTVCPNNNGHSIDTNQTTIIQTVSTSTVKAEEDSNGYFETSTVSMNIPTGTPGDVSEHDVVWPMDIKLWKSLITPTSDMVGDVIEAVASPETTVGVLTVAANVSDTVLYVNSTVTANTWRGFLITLDDGVNKDVLGRCTAVDSGAGTITVETPLSYAYAIGVPVKISVYIMKNVDITDTKTMEIGAKGIKGKMMNAGVILRVYYTNNSGTAKTIRWRLEYYNEG